MEPSGSPDSAGWQESLLGGEVFGAALFTGFEPQQFIHAVESRGLVAFGKRRVVEHRLDEVIDGTAETEHRLSDVQQLARALADDVDSK